MTTIVEIKNVNVARAPVALCVPIEIQTSPRAVPSFATGPIDIVFCRKRGVLETVSPECGFTGLSSFWHGFSTPDAKHGVLEMRSRDTTVSVVFIIVRRCAYPLLTRGHFEEDHRTVPTRPRPATGRDTLARIIPSSGRSAKRVFSFVSFAPADGARRHFFARPATLTAHNTRPRKSRTRDPSGRTPKNRTCRRGTTTSSSRPSNGSRPSVIVFRESVLEPTRLRRKGRPHGGEQHTQTRVMANDPNRPQSSRRGTDKAEGGGVQPLPPSITLGKAVLVINNTSLIFFFLVLRVLTTERRKNRKKIFNYNEDCK